MGLLGHYKARNKAWAVGLVAFVLSALLFFPDAEKRDGILSYGPLVSGFVWLWLLFMIQYTQAMKIKLLTAVGMLLAALALMLLLLGDTNSALVTSAAVLGWLALNGCFALFSIRERRKSDVAS